MLYRLGFAALFYWTGLTLGADTLVIPAKYVARDLGRSWILCNAPLDTWTPSERLTASHLLVGNEVLTLASMGLPELGQTATVADGTGIMWSWTFTSLPHFQISAPNGIVDEPKTASLFNFCSPSGDSTGGWMGIEFRGATSQLYPKKSMDTELWTSSDGLITWDYSFLGMRSDDDWHFFALYNEPARFNNYVGHKLWRSIAKVPYEDAEPEATMGIDQKYVEVFLNGSYHGIFCLPNNWIANN